MADVFERAETKYIITDEQRNYIENEIRKYMTADCHGESTIRNIYYDTPDFRLARRSIEKPVYKEKLRVRSYRQVNGNEKVFVELKKKYKGIVYKRRFSMPEQSVEDFIAGKSDAENASQIMKEISYFCKIYEGIRPQVFLSYDRSAYFGIEDSSLRISFDRNILWRASDLTLTSAPGGRPVIEPGMSIMEIKAAGSMPLWLVEILNTAKARKSSFSKYGTAYQTMLLESSLTYIKNLSAGKDVRTDRLKTGREAVAYA